MTLNCSQCSKDCLDHSENISFVFSGLQPDIVSSRNLTSAFADLSIDLNKTI